MSFDVRITFPNVKRILVDDNSTATSSERSSTSFRTSETALRGMMTPGIPVAPEADIVDGLLDVLLLPERGKADLVLLAAQILVGKHLTSDAIIFHRARKIGIRSKPGMWFNVDGELIGNEPATFELLPKALRCVVPAT